MSDSGEMGRFVYYVVLDYFAPPFFSSFFVYYLGYFSFGLSLDSSFTSFLCSTVSEGLFSPFG